MTKTISHIKVRKEWEIEDDFSSHRPALWLALKNTSEDVVELGSGMGSTPLLKKYCNDTQRELVSYETNEVWARKSGSIFTDSYFKTLGNIDLLFIDAAPAEVRKELIEYYKDIANVIVVHDSESGAEYVYGMSNVLSKFKYRLDYQPKGNPHTTIVSNTIDVTKWLP